MTRAILDTNVLAPAFIGGGARPTAPSAIIELWRTGWFELVVTPMILAELCRTFTDPYFQRRMTLAQMNDTLDLLVTLTVARPTYVIAGVATHPEDDQVLAELVSAAVDYFVTGDKQLLKLHKHHGVSIVEPNLFRANLVL